MPEKGPASDAEAQSQPQDQTRIEGDARSILDTAHEAFISMDAGGFITDWNTQSEETLGWSREEAVGKVLADLIVPERFREAHWEGLQRYLETGEGPVLGERLELSALHSDGHEIPIEITITALGSGPGHSFHAFLHDISERKHAELYLAAQHAVARALAEAESAEEAAPRLLAALAQGLEWEVGAWWERDDTDDVLRCREFWSDPEAAAPTEFEQLTRRTTFASGEGLPGRVWKSGKPTWVDDVIKDMNFPRAKAADAAGLHAAICLPIMRGEELRGVIEFLKSEVRQRPDELVDLMTSLTGQIGRFFTVLEERSEALKQLESLALTDKLTGLANRRAWDEGLAREMARAAREEQHLCVAFLDFDHFKRFNDERGHLAGDELLKATAEAWRERLRATDLLARYGGEEFALAFPGWPLDVALEIVERLRAAVPMEQTCSGGLVAWDGKESAEKLVGRADAALYEAKRAGRDRTVKES